MDGHNQKCCACGDSFKYDINLNISKCKSIVKVTSCEKTKNTYMSIMTHLYEIVNILEKDNITEKKQLKKHTMNLRPRKNNDIGIEIIGDAPTYPFYNFV